MRFYTLDFETYYAKDFTLSKLTSESYVRDPRFTVHMVGVKAEDRETVVLTDAQFRAMLPKLKLEESAVLCHHAQFDGFILAQHYGVHPKLFLDTLSMARSVFPMAKSNSLKALAERLGVGVKGTELVNSMGKQTLTPQEFSQLAQYCKNDVDLTYDIFQLMKGEVPPAELRLIDLTIKLFTNPILRLNPAILTEEHEYEIKRKEELLEACCSDKSVLASNPQFAALLERLGVTPPVKLSPAALKKGEEKWTYAFGKSDEGFKALLKHDDEAVRAVCEARLGVKSTIHETRALRLLGLAERGPVPIYLAYYGAHSGRFSGGDKVNWQNMPRGSRLRLALEAPPGYQIVVADLAQIEARVLAALAGEEALLDAFRYADAEEGHTDVYTDMASRVLCRGVTKADKAERQLGKALVLGCGYGLGADKFAEMQRVGMLGAPPNIFGVEMANLLGISPGDNVHLDCSKAIVNMYRKANPAIVRLWKLANTALEMCVAGGKYEFGVAPTISTEGDNLLLPNGMKIRYTGLRSEQTAKGRQFSKQGKQHPEKVYGGLVVENCVQALARIIMTDAMLHINKRYRVVLTVHDEILCCVPDEEAEACFDFMQKCMTMPPEWAPDLPLAVSGGWANNYSK
jgi:DNA polymerase I-like protein with 3'-5' exonuclease and polymerase domains